MPEHEEAVMAGGDTVTDDLVPTGQAAIGMAPQGWVSNGMAPRAETLTWTLHPKQWPSH